MSCKMSLSECQFLRHPIIVPATKRQRAGPPNGDIEHKVPAAKCQMTFS